MSNKEQGECSRKARQAWKDIRSRIGRPSNIAQSTFIIEPPRLGKHKAEVKINGDGDYMLVTIKRNYKSLDATEATYTGRVSTKSDLGRQITKSFTNSDNTDHVWPVQTVNDVKLFYTKDEWTVDGPG